MDYVSVEQQGLSTRFVHPKLEVKKTENKGQVVFAKELIEKGEFLAGVHGEICDSNEAKKRMDLIEGATDFQCNNYSMALVQYGNITRHVNHSCEPNSEAEMDYVFVEQRGKWWKSRCYLGAEQDIPKGTEVSISYRFDRANLMIDCRCGEKTKTKKTKPAKIKKSGTRKIDMSSKSSSDTSNPSDKDSREDCTQDVMFNIVYSIGPELMARCYNCVR